MHYFPTPPQVFLTLSSGAKAAPAGRTFRAKKMNLVSVHRANDEVFRGRGAVMASQNFTSGRERRFLPS